MNRFFVFSLEEEVLVPTHFFWSGLFFSEKMCCWWWRHNKRVKGETASFMWWWGYYVAALSPSIKWVLTANNQHASTKEVQFADDNDNRATTIIRKNITGPTRRMSVVWQYSNNSSDSTSLNIEVRYKSIIGRTKKLSFPSTCLSAWINALETCTLPWSLIRYHIECSLYLMLAINYLMTDQNWGEKIHHALLPGWIARRVRKKVSLISGLSSSGTTTTTTCFGSRDRQHLVSNMERCDCHLNFLSQIEPVRQPQTMCLTIWDFKVCDHHQNRLAHT